MSEPNLSIHSIGGMDLAVWDWPGDSPPIVLCHATSFHGRCWDQVAKSLPGHHLIAPESRGHGRSGKPPPPYHWRTFGTELAAVLAELGIQAAVGVGHSMGGHAVALAASINPELFRNLVLLEPVVRHRSAYTGPAPELDFVTRRRNRWASAQEMFERFRDRDPFQRWDRDVLWDYCRFGLVESSDGTGLVLGCPPAVEASIYANSSALDANIYDDIARVKVPVRVVRSTRDSGASYFEPSSTAPELAPVFPNGVDTALAHVSHFIPMEDPVVTARLIQSAVATLVK